DADLQAYYVDIRDTTIKVKNMIDSNVHFVYKFRNLDFIQTKHFVLNNDTILFLIKDSIVLLSNDWEKKVHFNLDTNHYIKSIIRDYPFYFQDNKIYIEFGN